MLACDFSSHRLQRGPTVLSDAQFDSLLAQMTPAGASDRQRLDFIVTFAPFTFLTCKCVPGLRICDGPRNVVGALLCMWAAALVRFIASACWACAVADFAREILGPG